MADINLRYKLTFEDYLSAQRLHAKRGIWPRVVSIIANWLYPLLGIFFFAIAFQEWRDRDATGSVVSSVFVGVLLIGCRFYVRWKYRRCYQRTRIGSGDTSMLFREDNFLTEEQDCGKSECSWNAVKSWREDAKVVLIYLAPARFIAIPKRAVSDSQLNDLRELLRRKVVPVVS
jgi:hypothetical protein